MALRVLLRRMGGVPGMGALVFAAAGAATLTFTLTIAGIARDGPVPPPAPAPWPSLLPCGDILVPVDKQHALPADCVPPDLVPLPYGLAQGEQFLRREAADAFVALAGAAARDGFRLTTDSAYRSYATQQAVFAQWVALLGLEQAERTSARPGHSEHQLGTTLDLCAPGACLESFIGTPEAGWVAAHAWEYGWVVSYPDEKEGITGYAFEPWHVRHVGPDVAARVRLSGLTLHEYLLR